MLISLQLGPETQQTIAALGEMGRSVAAAVGQGLSDGGQETASYIGEKYLSGQGMAGTLKSRSGNLREAVQSWMDGADTVVIGVPPGTPTEAYKWLLTDEQKIITPKKGKFLAIPIGEALTGSGVIKAQYNVPLKSIPGGFFEKTKSGRLLFGYKNGKKGKFRPLFTLVPSVLVQGSGALFDGVMESTPDMTAAIQKSVDKAIAS